MTAPRLCAHCVEERPTRPLVRTHGRRIPVVVQLCDACRPFWARYEAQCTAAADVAVDEAAGTSVALAYGAYVEMIDEIKLRAPTPEEAAEAQADHDREINRLSRERVRARMYVVRD